MWNEADLAEINNTKYKIQINSRYYNWDAMEVNMNKIIGADLPNMPWQDKPEGYRLPIWRYSENPIIGRDAIPVSNGVFRCDSLSISMDIFAGFSKDGIHWDINPEPITFIGEDKEILKREYRYDPRVCFIEDRYYITWCNGYHGPTIGVSYTFDFKTFVQLENAFLPYNRNGVLFTRKINGKYAMLSRPSDTGHTPFGDIFYSQSADMEYWGHHRFVMGTYKGDYSAWQSTKIGPGPCPIETEEGWLLIYHGVLHTCNGFVYRMGCAVLDLDEPWKVRYRSKNYILAPMEPYELTGDVPNVMFPCAALTDAATGRIAVYYGCADTVTGLAFTTADELINWAKNYPLT